MIALPPQITESFLPFTAGSIISLINKYTINGACCESVKPEEIDSESERDHTTQTKISNNCSKASAITATT